MGLSSKDVSSADKFDWSTQQIGALDMAKPTGQENPMQLRGPAAALRCPRCKSTNTKFCYYNNYSRAQPRHFCRACKRHWTEGGTLRNVPVGGGRKNKRPKTKDNDRRQQQHRVAASATPSPAELDNGFSDVLRQLMFPVQSSSSLSFSLPLQSDLAADYAVNPYSMSALWPPPSQLDLYPTVQEPVSNWNCWDGATTDLGAQELEQAVADNYSATIIK